jgi:hypothetical protein
MSQEYDNTNTGVLFVEEPKKSDNHPDFKGSIDVGGKEFWVSGWKKMSKGGKKMIKLAIDPKQPKSFKPAPQREEQDASAW